MDCFLFWIGQAGIILEIGGAGFIVWTAFKTGKNLEGKSHTIDAADAIESTINELKSQFKKEAKGFMLLVMGLMMQFIGGFGK